LYRYAKAGYADGLVDDDCGGAWLAIFGEVFAYRLAGIETAQKASGVAGLYTS
jgi:hypothetical protein